MQSTDVHLGGDTNQVFKDWQTSRIRFEPDVKINNGPYYTEKGSLHSVWRIYQDYHLVFVQAVLPMVESDV